MDIDLWHLVIIFFSGLIGESFGTLVGGGSLFIIPALLLTGVPLQSAIATDNAGSLGTEIGILSETRKKVMANKRMVILMAIPTTLGGIVGTYLLLTVSADIIKYFMAGAVMLVLIVARSHISKKPNLKKVKLLNYVVLIGFLFLIGIYANFIAAGEGTFSRMGMMVILGMTFIQSTGIKATATMPARIYSLVVTGLAGYIVWPYLLTLWASNFIAGKYAMKFAKKIPDLYMRTAITFISLGFVIYLLFFY